MTALGDGCGLAPMADGFVATSGEGRIVGIGRDGSATDIASQPLAFDNHIAAIALG